MKIEIQGLHLPKLPGIPIIRNMKATGEINRELKG